MQNNQQGNWQPISELPFFTKMIAEYQYDAEDLLVTLEEVKSKPHIFDDETVDRITALYSGTTDFLKVYNQQLDRWLKAKPTKAEKAEISLLKTVLPKVQKLAFNILALAKEIRTGTINRIMDMDDMELGLRALMGQFPRSCKNGRILSC